MNMMRRDLPARPDARTPSAPASPPRPAAPRPAAPARPGMPQQPVAARPQAAARPGVNLAGVRPGMHKGDELFQIIKQLSELLTKENAALRNHRSDEVKSLTERKEQLARLYQGSMNAVHRDPNILKNLEPAKRSALTQAAMRMGDLMQENASLLKANIQSINMFFKAVTDAVRERQEKKTAAYSRNGAFDGYTVTKRSLAMSFNQTM